MNLEWLVIGDLNDIKGVEEKQRGLKLTWPNVSDLVGVLISAA